MRAATAVAALLCLLCVSESARLSVFREEFNGVPGRTFVVLHGDGDSNAALPGGLEWLAQQMALLRAVHTHMMLSLTSPDLPSTMSDSVPQPQSDDPLRRVRCQRMRQAMREQEQDIWASEFGSGSVNPMATEQAECYNVHGNTVPCSSDEAVMQDNWMDINRPVDSIDHPALALGQRAALPRPTRDAATSTEPLDDWQVVDGDSVTRLAGDSASASINDLATDDDRIATTVPTIAAATGSAAAARHYRLVEDSRSADDTWLASTDSSASASASLNQEESLSDLPFFDQAPLERPAPQGGLLLAAAGTFCLALVTVAAAVLLVLAVVRRRCGGGGCSVDALLVAPLLAPQPVYGVKVAATEAAREEVKGIDTTAALLKGQGL